MVDQGEGYGVEICVGGEARMESDICAGEVLRACREGLEWTCVAKVREVWTAQVSWRIVKGMKGTDWQV